MQIKSNLNTELCTSTEVTLATIVSKKVIYIPATTRNGKIFIFFGPKLYSKFLLHSKSKQKNT